MKRRKTKYYYHGNIKCDCGHHQKDHFGGTGWCHYTGHSKEGECGCTWFHPNVKYIRRKQKEKAKNEKS